MEPCLGRIVVSVVESIRTSFLPPFILWIALLVSPVSATEKSCDDEGSSCDDTVIEVVYVTATRRVSPVESVPGSVTALSGDRLALMGAASFEGYARSVPGLSFSDAGLGGKNYVIRGVSTGIYGGANSATAVYFDETPISDRRSGPMTYPPDPLLVDIARIEVLRGPQGTLFGSGSMGGAIRIISNQPDLDSYEGFAEAIIANTKHGGLGYDARALINVPLVADHAAIRAVAYYGDSGGWIDNTLLGRKDVNSNEVKGFRLAGLWSSQDRWTVKANIVHHERSSDGTGIDEDNPPWTQQRRVKEKNGDEWSLYSLDIGYDFDWGQLVSTTSITRRNLDNLVDATDFYQDVLSPVFPPELLSTVVAVEHREQENFAQEIRLSSSDDGRLDWLLGLFYQDQDYFVEQQVQAPGFDDKTGGLAAMYGAADTLLIGQGKQPLEELAVFADMIWSFNDHWEGSIGGRWFRFEHGYQSSGFGLLLNPPTFSKTAADETGFTPKISLSWNPAADVMLYGTIAGGYRPGGANETAVENFPGCAEELASYGLSGIPNSYESDSLWSYELGFKSSWPDHQVYLNAAAYYIDWTDIQTAAALICGASWRENSGSATSQGIEFELAAYPGRNFEITLNGAWTDARLSEDVPGLGGLDGDQIPGVPKYAWGGSATWFFNVFDGVDGSMRVDYQYVGGSWNAFRYVRHEIPSHALTNLRFSFHKNRWEASLFFNNLLNERAIITVNNNPAGQYVTTAPPFTFGVSVRFTY